MSNGPNKDEVLQYISRIERLEEDKKNVAEDIKSVYTELKGNGYDAKIIRKLVSIRRRTNSKKNSY